LYRDGIFITFILLLLGYQGTILVS
jgi:hypothetical protein